MLSLSEIEHILFRVSYKPGWTIRAMQGTFEGVKVQILAQVVDSYNPEATVCLDVWSTLPPIQDEDQFLLWLAWRLKQIEIHEMQEWFKLDGRAVFDPHAEGADRDAY